MANDGIEEETYSVIFTSLKHPVRRKILRMLADKPFTFSEILQNLNIDSGHLSYHLENLGDLVLHAQEGKYQLSSIGVAAVKLMGGVEENPPTTLQRKFKPRKLISKVFPAILLLCLIFASLFAVTFTTAVATATLNEDQPDSFFGIQPTPFIIGAGQTFEFNVTVIHHSNQGVVSFGETAFTSLLTISGTPGPNAYTFKVPPPTNTLTGSEAGLVWLDASFNTTELVDPDTRVLQNSGLPRKFSIKVYLPNGTEPTSGYDTFTTIGGAKYLAGPQIQVTQLGTYRFEITNNDSFDWTGTLSPNLQWQQLEKPYFYYGVAGLIIALGYVAFVTAGLLKMKKNKN